MRFHRLVAVLGLLLAIPPVGIAAGGQTIESARAERDRAKAELIRAQEAFDRADAAYIEALSGASGLRLAPPAGPSSAPSAPKTASASRRPSVVTFGLSGPLAQISNPFSYRARVVVDGEARPWTQHASGAKVTIPADAKSLTYEVQADAKDDVRTPEWRTVCAGDLPAAGNVVIDVEIGRKIGCRLK